MKKLLLVVPLLYILNPNNVFAGAAGGGATEVTQLLNHAELLPMNISDALTSVSTNGSFIKQTVLDPIANQLINQAIQGAAGDVLSWINGGFAGQPLIVSDPEKVIKDTALGAAKSGIKAIPRDSIFGDSVFSSLASKYSFQALPLKDKIEELSKTDGPEMIQNDFCDDDKLTAQATEDVAKDGGEVTNEAIVARKNELYAYACEGDPNDPEIAKKLENISEQTGAGGWDLILCKSAGNCKEDIVHENIANAIDEEAANQEDLKTRDLYEGLNTMSATECGDDSSSDDSGDSSDDSGSDSAINGLDEIKPCNNPIVTTPADSVQALSDLAEGSGLQRMFNITVDGGFSSMLSNMVSGFINAGINKAFQGTNSRSVNSSTVNGSTSGTQNNLTSPSAKSEFTAPMLAQISNYKATLVKLQGIDQSYESDLNAYASRIDAGLQCYQDLVADNLTSKNDQGLQFFQQREQQIAAVRNTIEPEMAKISEALVYVASVENKINASQSTQEITNIYSAYTAKVTSEGYPTQSTASQREAEYKLKQIDIQHDTNVDTYLQRCHQTRDSANSTGN